jgi:hypothetical protein
LGVLTLTDFLMLDYLRAHARPGFFQPASEPNGEANVRRIPNLFLLLAALAGVASTGCQSGGVGDPCVPEDEYRTGFSGYSASEVNVESRSFQCETRVCLVANFQGRVSCPYGQDAIQGGTTVDPSVGENGCFLPGASKSNQAAAVTVPVTKQYSKRRPDTSVYCSCRCDGPDSTVNYCQCPSGYTCEKLVTDYGFGSAQLAGSYCIKDGTQYKATNLGNPCDRLTGNCGPVHPQGI